jgi:hypothetical protein
MTDSLTETGQAGAETKEVQITPAMIEAGVAEFQRWFELPEHQEELAGMPPNASLTALARRMFCSMISKSP